MTISKPADSQVKLSGGNAARLLVEADKARDSRQWSEAAELYRAYLQLRPSDGPLWVQYGHALKESGRLDEAESAYRKSLTLAPGDADTQLQLGHLYKRMRNFSAAIVAYREALRLDRKLVDASRELIALGVDSRSIANDDTGGLPAREPCLVIDFSDVFFYLQHHKTVSGIQRVQLGIAQAITEMGANDRPDVLFVTEGDNRLGYVIIDEVYLSELRKELFRNTVEHDRIKELLSSAKKLGQLYEPVAGDTFLMLGAFWVIEGVAGRIIALKRSGVHLGVLIHDIIPISHSEFCEKSLTDEFKSYFFSVVSVADFVLAVSDHSGRAVKKLMHFNDIPETPVLTLRSAHRTWEPAKGTFAVSPEVGRLVKEDYVLYVSTIEIRKNHTYLFRIWKQLIEKRGWKNVPRLVFVGRPGWRVRDLMDQLASTSYLNGKIKILHDLSDNELATLYRSAMFSVFPSFEEGWGLPVGESLIFGRPCIASNTSSVPEVGGDFVDYIDPFNVHDGYEKIARLIDDEVYREQRAAHIRANFKPRDWGHVAKNMLELVDSIKGRFRSAQESVKPPCLKPGRKYNFGHNSDVPNFIESGDAKVGHFSFDAYWYPVEHFGRWLRSPGGSVDFTLEHTSDEQIFLLLQGRTAPWLSETKLQIAVNGISFVPTILKADQAQYFLLKPSHLSGVLKISFSSVGDIAEGPDPRVDLFFALSSISYAPSTDMVSRLSILEELVLGTNNVIELKQEM